MSGGGTWRGGPASDLQAAIQTGLPAPTSVAGTVFAGVDMNSLRANGSGQMIALGSLQTGVGGVTAGNARGIWLGTPGNLELVARQRFEAPGTGGALFAGFGFAGLNDSGATAFAASLVNGNGVTSANNQGIWRGTAGNLDLIARKGNVAPGTGGQVFQEFQQVSISNSGLLAMTAQIGPSNRVGLWRADGDSIDPVLLPGQPVPGWSGDVSMVGASSVVINGQGVVAFQGFFEGADVGAWQGRSLWVDDGTDLRMLARQGDVVPGTNGTATFGSDFIGTEFNAFLNDAGIVAFQADIAMAGVAGNSDAIFAYDLQGNLLLSLKYGDQLEVAPGDFRTITALSLTYNYDNSERTLAVGSGGQDGRPSPLNDRNELAFRASFGAFDSGIFVITVPEPGSFVTAGLGCLGFAIFCLFRRHP
jgi:hypothetical protein